MIACVDPARPLVALTFGAVEAGLPSPYKLTTILHFGFDENQKYHDKQSDINQEQ